MMPTSKKAVSAALILSTLWTGAANAQELRRTDDSTNGTKTSVGSVVTSAVVIGVSAVSAFYVQENLDLEDLRTRHLVKDQTVLGSGNDRVITSNFSIVDEALKTTMPGDVVTITNRPQTPGALLWAVDDLAKLVGTWESRVEELKLQKAEYSKQVALARDQVNALPYKDIERIRSTAAYKQFQAAKDRLRLTGRALDDATMRATRAMDNFTKANYAANGRPLGVSMNPADIPELTYDLLVDNKTARHMDEIFGHQYGGIKNAMEIPVELRVAQTKTPNIAAKKIAFLKARGGLAGLAFVGVVGLEEVFVGKIRKSIDSSLENQTAPEARTSSRSSGTTR